MVKLCHECKTLTHTLNCRVYLSQQAEVKGLRFNDGRLTHNLGDRMLPAILLAGVQCGVPETVERVRALLHFKPHASKAQLVAGLRKRYTFA